LQPNLIKNFTAAAALAAADLSFDETHRSADKRVTSSHSWRR